MVIIVEGIDGVGKTTICRALCEKDKSLNYIKESYTSDNIEKENRIKLMLERIISKDKYLYDRTTLIDDFVYNFLNENDSSLKEYFEIIIALLSQCQIFHLCLDEQTRKKRFEERGDQYITNDMIEKIKKSYNNFYSNLNNVETVELSGELNDDVKKIVRRIKK